MGIPIKAKRLLSWALTTYITDLPKSANRISASAKLGKTDNLTAHIIMYGYSNEIRRKVLTMILTKLVMNVFRVIDMLLKYIKQ